uniref:SFRICE_031889 n=1 Tax=Spodoptera frugiperda TaxID=7108 RepID=A0A2H1VIZ8_SPOFR
MPLLNTQWNEKIFYNREHDTDRSFTLRQYQDGPLRTDVRSGDAPPDWLLNQADTRDKAKDTKAKTGNRHSPSKYESNDPYQAKIHRVVQARDVTLTVNTNLTTPLKSKSIKPFRLQSVPNNYTYIKYYEKHWRNSRENKFRRNVGKAAGRVEISKYGGLIKYNTL